jgi:hypothetical protein
VARPKALFCLPHEFTHFEMPTFKAEFYCVFREKEEGMGGSFPPTWFIFRSREELL